MRPDEAAVAAYPAGVAVQPSFVVRAAVLAGLALSVLLASACSHRKPYIRPGQPAHAEPPPVESILSRVLLIGDAGEPAPRDIDPTLWVLSAAGSELAEKTLIVFLGDNLYPIGLPDSLAADRSYAEAKLQAQLDAVERSGARGLFVPGNHGWARGRPNGLAMIRNQANFVKRTQSFLPTAGCPGPESYDLPGVRIIALDTQWWLHDHDKETESCIPGGGRMHPDELEARILKNLTDQVLSAPAPNFLVVSHHPPRTHGPHGAFFTLKDHIFPLTNLASWAWLPLPGIGSLYPITRRYFTDNEQDLFSRRYGRMADRLMSTLAQSKKNGIYAAGHDHSLQVIENADAVGHVLVSGAGAAKKITEVGHGDDTLFAQAHAGFMSLDYLADGRVYLRVIIAPKKEGKGQVVYSTWLD